MQTKASLRTIACQVVKMNPLDTPEKVLTDAAPPFDRTNSVSEVRAPAGTLITTDGRNSAHRVEMPDTSCSDRSEGLIDFEGICMGSPSSGNGQSPQRLKCSRGDAIV